MVAPSDVIPLRDNCGGNRNPCAEHDPVLDRCMLKGCCVDDVVHAVPPMRTVFGAFGVQRLGQSPKVVGPKAGCLGNVVRNRFSKNVSSDSGSGIRIRLNFGPRSDFKEVNIIPKKRSTS